MRIETGGIGRGRLAVALLAVAALSCAVPAEAAFSADAYARVLARHVDDAGGVDYAGLKSDPGDLREFLSAMAALDPSAYESWDERGKIAFWINAYNALTLEAIVRNYPIRASVLRSFVYPRNSIRQIPGVWTDLHFEVMGRKTTLDAIEHETLRAEFDEPRIHMALVCAARSCPPLRNEPYAGERLDEQLDDQTRRFLGDPGKFRIDRDAGEVRLSSIFKWFGEDFAGRYGTERSFGGRGTDERAVLSFVAAHLGSEDRDYLERGGYSVEYLKYDWSLNDKEPADRD